MGDFYLPECDVYIEFLGNWNTSDRDKQRYKEKMRVYNLNGLKCIWIYPNQLHYTFTVIQEGLLNHGVILRKNPLDEIRESIRKAQGK